MIDAGTVLVSHPEQNTGVFARSVVLITEHHARGTVGCIVNKSTGIEFAQIMRERGCEWPWPDPLYQGGPVNTTALVMLHTTEWRSTNTMIVNSEFAISSDNLMTEKAAMGNTPTHYRMINGLSGWAPGQLERELDQQRWLTVESAHSDCVFADAQGDAQWRQFIDLAAAQAVSAYF